MNYTWIYIFLVMMAGNIILGQVPVSYYIPAVFAVNTAVFIAACFLLYRDRFLFDFRANMLFMLGLTVIHILTDLGIMSYTMSWLAFGALFVWSMSGGGRSR